MQSVSAPENRDMTLSRAKIESFNYMVKKSAGYTRQIFYIIRPPKGRLRGAKSIKASQQRELLRNIKTSKGSLVQRELSQLCCD